MKCAIGEQLVSTHIIAHGWPTVNVNSSICRVSAMLFNRDRWRF